VSASDPAECASQATTDNCGAEVGSIGGRALHRSRRRGCCDSLRPTALTIAGADADGVGRQHEQQRLVRFFNAVASDLGYPLPPGASVLDFGCGIGDAVAAWRAAGYEAYGCDIVLEQPGEWLHVIERPYRLPFSDATFDLVVSNQVLEHVQDHDAAFSEICRVLKPGALSLHLFPSRWSPREVHVRVPLASLLQARWWIGLWAWLGIRNEYQNGLSWRDVTEFNLEYLHKRTNYLSRRDLIAAGQRSFEETRFIENLFLKHGKRTQRVYPLVRLVPPLARLYSGLRSRFLMLRARGR
jgi:SAM-dependent methyltransferase